jgi:diaminopimelate decarboxylase
MHSFHYQRGKLTCESYSLDKAAEQYGTPLYVYSAHTIADHYQRLDQSLHNLSHQICYAVKANSNLAVIRLLAERGAGFDIVSGGELYRVIKAGGNPLKCTFAGVGKSREEIEYALRSEVLSLNVESEQELAAISEIAKSLNKRAPVAIRVNPGVWANTHKYISTGKAEDKFGIGIDRAAQVYRRAQTLPNVTIRGVQMHIGSQIVEAKPFVQAIEKMLPLVRHLKSDCGIEFFSIGGGIGIVYKGSLESGDEVWWKDTSKHGLTIDQYAGAAVPLLRDLGVRILLEPGRFIVGNAGVLLTRVLYIKRTPAKTFVIVDAGMNDLIRPALYQGFHEVVSVRESKDRSVLRADVVGPVCETGDFFALDREIKEVEPGDVLALMSAGAYGFTMASNYNSRPLPAEVLVSGTEARLIRRRQTYADLIAPELEEG